MKKKISEFPKMQGLSRSRRGGEHLRFLLVLTGSRIALVLFVGEGLTGANPSRCSLCTSSQAPHAEVTAGVRLLPRQVSTVPLTVGTGQTNELWKAHGGCTVSFV